MGAGGAVVLLLFLALEACLFLAGIASGIVWMVTRRRGQPEAWRWLTIGFLGVAIALPAGLFVYGSFVDDPDVLELDLRGARSTSQLPGEEGEGGFWDVDSDRVDLRLPDGRRLRSRVDGTLLTVDGTHVETLTVRGPAERPKAAAERTRRWAHAVRVPVRGIDERPRSRDWKLETNTGDMRVEPSVQAVDGGRLAIARLELTFDGA
ncbi:MAG: hypothetical protein JWM98_3209 [Thermoleophilia bacterium]|nr:hypothetical protein [Thermoleophilia bacterium]